ncbi:MAG: hypothetical protein WAV45_04820 [Propionibacteriaceae bacterium]
MITLYLRCRLATSREALEEFFFRARSTYEAPSGITACLQWNLDDPASFVEVFAYQDRATFEADQVRVNDDPAMRALIAEWHTHLDGPPLVEACEDARPT